MSYTTFNSKIERANVLAYARAYCTETTTPRGVGPKYHLRGASVWSWGHQGNQPHLIKTHEYMGEAKKHLHEIYLEQAKEASYMGYAPYLHDSLCDAIDYLFELVETDADVAKLVMANDVRKYKNEVYAEAARRGFNRVLINVAIADLIQKEKELQAEKDAMQKQNDDWARQVQSARCREDAQAAHAVALRLSVNNGKVVFDSVEYDYSINEHGTVQIDTKLNNAARASGLVGQAIGELYSIAQRMVAESLHETEKA